MLFPSKMRVAKITVPSKYTRNVTKALQDLGSIEFIDMEHKTHAAGMADQSHREEIFDLLNRVTALTNILGLDKEIEPRKKAQVDDTEIENVLNFTRTLLQKTEGAGKDLHKQKAKIEKVLELTKNLGLDFFQMERLGKGDYVTTIIGHVDTELTPQLKWKIYEVTDSLCYFDSHEVDAYESLILTTSLKKYSDAIRRILRVYGFKELDISDIMEKDELPLSSGDIQEFKEKAKTYEEQLSEMKKSHGLELLAAEELLMIEKKNLEVTTYFKETSNGTTIMYGWAPKSKQKKIKKLLEDTTDQKGSVEFQQPTFKDEEFPTNIEHRGFLAPLTNLVTSYGSPLYTELDPTLFMFVTFPLIFGMMFADIGHGAVLALLSVLALIGKRKKIVVNELIDYFIKGAELLFLCGLSSIFWGFVFGSVFGDHFGSKAHPLHPYTPVGEFFQEINPIFWFSPMGSYESVTFFSFYLAPLMTLMIISFFVAALHITMGISLKFIRLIKEGHVLEAVTVPLMLLWLYWGALYIVYQAMPRNEEGLITKFSLNVSALMTNPIQLVIMAGVPLIIMVIGLFAVHGGEGAMEGLEYVLALLSNTISYGRIVALNAVHAILSVLIFEPFLGLGSMFWVIGFVLNTVLVGLLEGLLAFIHTLRLHWVEWFSKFYSGTGTEFKPFATERKFTQMSASSIQ